MRILRVLFKPKQDVARLKEKRDIKGLIKALKYRKNWLVRSRAAKALGEIGDTRAVEPLCVALKDENLGVQTDVAKALKKIEAKG